MTGPVSRKTLVRCRLSYSESATRCSSRANFAHPSEQSWEVSFGKLQGFLLLWTCFCLGYKETATDLYVYGCSDAGGDSMVLIIDSITAGWLIFRQSSVSDKGRQER